MERERRDEVAIIRVKLNADNAVRMMVEKLISLGVSEKEIADAIEHLKHVAKTKAISELSKRLPRTG
jgi:alkylhydroperoxidase/carboxymuconolactone decarboxylase family protein YurZ